METNTLFLEGDLERDPQMIFCSSGSEEFKPYKFGRKSKTAVAK